MSADGATEQATVPATSCTFCLALRRIALTAHDAAFQAACQKV